MKSLRAITACLLAVLLAAGNAVAVTTTATVSAIVDSTETISLANGTVAFGSIAGTATTYRLRKPLTGDSQLTVSYFATGPYEIRVYTDNGVGSGFADARGFIRSATTAAADRLYLKVWCPNFSANSAISGTVGPTLSTTTSQTRYLWAGYNLDGDGTLDEVLTSGTFSEATLAQDLNGDGDIVDSITATASSPVGEGASLSWIREFDTQTNLDTVASAQTRCVLAWNTPVRGDGSLDNPFPVVFAVDLNGVKDGTYTSANNGTTPVTTGQTAANGVIFELLLF